MKICIIGSSGHAGYVLTGLQGQDDMELLAIAPGTQGESVEMLLRNARSKGHSPELFQQYTEMLDQLKPDIVVVASHFNKNASIAIEALNRGMHVFTEKPVATTLQDLEAVKAAYKQSNSHLAAMMGIRYTSSFLTAKKIIQEGSIGEIRLMNAQKSYKLGERSDFYKKRESYGGTIPWVGSHAVDWMYWLSGEQFQSVFASHSTISNSGHGELEATGLCHYTFSNEVFGSINIDYLRPKQASSHADDRIRIAGTKGILEVREGKVLLINDQAEGTQEITLLPAEESFTDFLQQVRGLGKCMVSAEQSFIVTEACLKARLSADRGCVVYF